MGAGPNPRALPPLAFGSWRWFETTFCSVCDSEAVSEQRRRSWRRERAQRAAHV